MLTALPAYAELISSAGWLEGASPAALLADANRSRRLVFRAGESTLDVSRQRVDHNVMAQLIAWPTRHISRRKFLPSLPVSGLISVKTDRSSI